MLESILQVTSTSTSIAQEGVRIQLTPIPFVINEETEHNLFDADGSGSISIVVTLPDVVNFFIVGKRYEVSFKAL